MSKILLIESNPNFRDLLAVNLNMYVGVDVIARASLAEAIEVLKIVPEMDVIVTRDKIGKDVVPNEIYRLLQSLPRAIPMVVMGEDHQLQGAVKTVKGEGQSLLKDVVGSCAKILGITAKIMVNKVVPDYYPVDLKYFYHLGSSPCDVYVRIHKGEGEYQYVKRIHPKEDIGKDSLQNYEKKGVREFFVESKFRLEFTKQLVARITTRFEDTKAKMEDRLTALGAGQDLVSEDLRTLGVTEEVVSLANAAILSMTKIAATTPSLRNLMAGLLKSKGSFRYRHTQILTYLTFHMIGRMEWGSKEQADKLAFMAFFHDISLHSDEEAIIHSADELKKSNVDPEIADRINKHAYTSCELVKAYPSIPLGADALIKQHHGSKNGIGFPEGNSSSISPLSIVFIIAEDFTVRLLKNPERPFEPKLAIQEMEKKFDLPKYRKVLEVLGPTLGLSEAEK